VGKGNIRYIFNGMDKRRKRENKKAKRSTLMTTFLIIVGIFVALRLLAEIFPGLKP
jgi:hypothetical protein